MNNAEDDIFELGLPRRLANHRPLTPLDFLSWCASVFPDRAGVVYGRQALSWGEVDRRCRRLASALVGLGVGRGDTVAVMCPNTPPMLEAHYGVPMAGAVLNALNYRLDAASIAFILEHGEAKVLLTDSEWAPVIEAALAQVQRPITVIDIVDPAAPGERLGVMDYEALLDAHPSVAQSAVVGVPEAYPWPGLSASAAGAVEQALGDGQAAGVHLGPRVSDPFRAGRVENHQIVGGFGHRPGQCARQDVHRRLISPSEPWPEWRFPDRPRCRR